VKGDEGRVRECLIQESYHPAWCAINVNGIQACCRVFALREGLIIIIMGGYQLHGNYDLRFWATAAALVF
jgi:hypothetical protein